MRLFLVGLIILLSITLLSKLAVAKDVNLAWDASPTEGVTGYQLCYSTIEGMLVAGQDLPTEGMLPTCVDAGNNLTGNIVGLDDATPYYIGAVAYNAAEQKSKLSNIVLAPGFLVPEAPSNLTGSVKINTVDVPVQ